MFCRITVYFSIRVYTVVKKYSKYSKCRRYSLKITLIATFCSCCFDERLYANYAKSDTTIKAA